jgi:hypothetical protein
MIPNHPHRRAAFARQIEQTPEPENRGLAVFDVLVIVLAWAVLAAIGIFYAVHVINGQ